MSDAPERIWVLRPDDWDIMIIEEPCDGWDGYVRADLFDAQARRIEELEGALRDVHDDLLARGLDKSDPETETKYRQVSVGRSVWMQVQRALSKGTEGE